MHSVFDFAFWKWVAAQQRAGDDLRLLADAISLSKMSSAPSTFLVVF